MIESSLFCSIVRIQVYSNLYLHREAEYSTDYASPIGSILDPDLVGRHCAADLLLSTFMFYDLNYFD